MCLVSIKRQDANGESCQGKTATRAYSLTHNFRLWNIVRYALFKVQIYIKILWNIENRKIVLMLVNQSHSETFVCLKKGHPFIWKRLAFYIFSIINLKYKTSVPFCKSVKTEIYFYVALFNLFSMNFLCSAFSTISVYICIIFSYPS